MNTMNEWMNEWTNEWVNEWMNKPRITIITIKTRNFGKLCESIWHLCEIIRQDWCASLLLKKNNMSQQLAWWGLEGLGGTWQLLAACTVVAVISVIIMQSCTKEEALFIAAQRSKWNKAQSLKMINGNSPSEFNNDDYANIGKWKCTNNDRKCSEKAWWYME